MIQMCVRIVKYKFIIFYYRGISRNRSRYNNLKLNIILDRIDRNMVIKNEYIKKKYKKFE